MKFPKIFDKGISFAEEAYNKNWLMYAAVGSFILIFVMIGLILYIAFAN